MSLSKFRRLLVTLSLVVGTIGMTSESAFAAYSCSYGSYCLYDNGDGTGATLPSSVAIYNLGSAPYNFNDATDSLKNSRGYYTMFYQSYNFTPAVLCKNANGSTSSNRSWGFGISSVDVPSFGTYCP